MLLQLSAKNLAECVDLLLQLNEPAEVLCEEFLSQYVSICYFYNPSINRLLCIFTVDVFVILVYSLFMHCLFEKIANFTVSFLHMHCSHTDRV